MTLETDRQTFTRNVAEQLARAEKGAVVVLVMVQPSGAVGGSLAALGETKEPISTASLLGLITEEVVLLVQELTQQEKEEDAADDGT